MKSIRSLCLLACILAVASAHEMRSNSVRGNSKPTDWMPVRKLESLPALDEITVSQLERLSAPEGGAMLHEINSIAKSKTISPDFKLTAEDIPAYIPKPNGEKIEFKLSELVSIAKRMENFGKNELTIFMTGLPQSSKYVREMNNKLIRNQMKRNEGEVMTYKLNKYEDDGEEDRRESKVASENRKGDLLVIDLDKAIENYRDFAMLDTNKVGKVIGDVLRDLTNETPAAKDKIFVVAQGVAAHVAGAAGRRYNAACGHTLRRITALNPTDKMTDNYETLEGLTRGDASFVDCIHTCAYGMGTTERCGDVDFFVNGIVVAPKDSDNIIEACALATGMYAESLLYGNEHSFPAMRAESLRQYKSNEGFGPRAYLGVATDFDIKGDYFLEANTKSPHARRTPSQHQHGYHAAHQSWREWEDKKDY